jgi:hypothetical protein
MVSSPSKLVEGSLPEDTKLTQHVSEATEPGILPVNRVPDTNRRSRRPHNENLSTPSISMMLNGGTLSEVSEPETHLKKGKFIANGQLFDQNQLTETWKAFADTVDAAQLKSALSVRDPILNEDFSVVYNLDNEVQRQRIIQDLKPKLLAYLHKKLNNDSISIEFNVTENLEEIMNKPYTDQEKFNTLLAKYPLLGIMKQRFGLDFE